MSNFSSLPIALVMAVGFAWASHAAAEDVTLEHCTVLKAEGTGIWVIGPCERPAALEVATDATITVDGKAIRLGDLAPGLCVKLTMQKVDGELLVVKIEGTSELMSFVLAAQARVNAPFEPPQSG